MPKHASPVRVSRWRRGVAAVLALLAVPMASPAFAETAPAPTAVDFPVDCNTHPNGLFTFLDIAPVQDIYFAFDSCGYTPEKMFIGVRYQGQDGRSYTRSYCVGEGLTRVAWVQYDHTAPNLPNEYISGSIGSRSDCALTPVVVPPRPGEQTVTATGIVEIERNSGGAHMRGLSGARYELWYWGRNGLGTPIEWRRATTGLGGTGAPVEGFLDDDGRYELTFAYPNRQTLPDGSAWEGCPKPANPTPHLDSYACEPQHVVLNIYPEDEERVIRVFEPDRTEIIPAAEVFLGRYFDEPDKRTKPISFAAHAYAGVRNVYDLVGGIMEPVTVKLVPGVHSNYRPGRKEILLDPGHARSYVPEHEAAHHVEKTITGASSAPGCREHNWFTVTNARCAWQEGFADFLGVLAENPPGQTTWTTAFIGSYVGEIEQCQAGSVRRMRDCPTRFGDADARRAMEGWVAAALWDLVDDSPLETRDGFADLVTHDISVVLSALSRAKPTTFHEFFMGLTTRGGGEMEVAFMNRQVYEVIADQVSRVGDWISVMCGCPTGRAWLHEPVNATPEEPLAEATWEVNVRGRLSPGEYELWVNVPVSAWFVPMDEAALYQVAVSGTAGGSGRIDQTIMGWHRLAASVTVRSGDSRVSVTLKGGTDDRAARKGLTANALVFIPKA